ncbi:MAG: helix-turn-helix domain-containing protein [Bacteroidales bacterium]|jgi:AraC-like DNA-binding protein
MENNLFFSEFIQGMGSLALAILSISAMFIVVYNHFKFKNENENKLLLKSLATSLIFIALLTFQRLVLKWPFGLNQDIYLFLTTGYVIQLFLPIQIYFLQKGEGVLQKYSQVLYITGGFFFLNCAMIYSSPYLSSTLITAIRHLLQTIMIMIVIYHIQNMYKVFKETITTQNKEFFSFVLDLLVFLTSSIFLVILFGSMFMQISMYKIEAIKTIFFIINIYIVAKCVYSSSLPEYKDDTPSAIMQNILCKDQSDGNGKFDELKYRLLEYFNTEKPYLDSKLNISQVSLYLYSNKTYLSRLINESFRSNFNQFVNYYRVEEAKRLFKENTKLSIQQLCDLSGFGSSATFTMAFRIYCGTTPADWCREYKIKSKNGGNKENT